MKKSALHMLGVSSPMNQNNKKGEIKTWNEGEPNIIGSSGLLGVIGGGGLKVLSKLWKTFSNTPNQYLRAMTKPKPPVTSKPPRQIGEFERRAAEYLNRRVSKGTATADDIKQLNIYNKRTNFGQR